MDVKELSDRLGLSYFVVKAKLESIIPSKRSGPIDYMKELAKLLDLDENFVKERLGPNGLGPPTINSTRIVSLPKLNNQHIKSAVLLSDDGFTVFKLTLDNDSVFQFSPSGGNIVIEEID